MTFSRSNTLPLLVLLGLSAAVSAQSTKPAGALNINGGQTITISAVVTSKDSKEPIGGLTKQDFGLLDNGQPVPSVSFHELGKGQQPQRAIMVVDALNIRITGQEYVREQVSNFLKNTELTVPFEVALLTDKGVQIQEGFSTDGAGMAKQLSRQPMTLRGIPQSTGVYGAGERMDISVNGLTSIAARAAALPGRTLVLWVSPGWPILSGVGIELSRKDELAIYQRIASLSTLLREARVTLYAIDPIGAGEAVGRANYFENYLKPATKPSEVDLGDESLQVLAIQSGGLYMNSSDIGQSLKQALADTSHYYEFTFPAAYAEKPNTFHAILLKVDQPRYTLRTRVGYYAQP